MTTTTTSSTAARRVRSGLALIVLAYIAFISLGLPDGLLGVAWPSIRANFRLPLDALGMSLMAGSAGYLVSSFFSGKLIGRFGVGGVLAGSCLMTGLCLLGYTLVPVWGLFVLLAVFGGFGAGAIDAGLNTYIAANHGEGLMQWLHACFGVGVTLGPVIMTAGLNNFSSWRFGYHVVGVAQILLGLTFLLTVRMWKASNPDAAEHDRKLTDYRTPFRATLREPGAWLSFALFFIYVGVELSLGHWAYTLLTEGRGIEPSMAAVFAGSYWGTFTIGRILAGLYTKRVGVIALLRGSLIAALLGALLLAWNPSNAASLAGVAIIGFAIAPIFPALVSATTLRVSDAHAANTIGMQISAAGVGGALLPGLAGVLGRQISLEAIPAYLVTLIAILLVLMFIGRRKTA